MTAAEAAGGCSGVPGCLCNDVCMLVVHPRNLALLRVTHTAVLYPFLDLIPCPPSHVLGHYAFIVAQEV